MGLGAGEVTELVAATPRRFQARCSDLVATSSRPSFGFAGAPGRGSKGLEGAVPLVAGCRRGLVWHLDPRFVNELMASLGTLSGPALRDRAIISRTARSGL